MTLRQLYREVSPAVTHGSTEYQVEMLRKVATELPKIIEEQENWSRNCVSLLDVTIAGTEDRFINNILHKLCKALHRRFCQ